MLAARTNCLRLNSNRNGRRAQRTVGASDCFGHVSKSSQSAANSAISGRQLVPQMNFRPIARLAAQSNGRRLFEPQRSMAMEEFSSQHHSASGALREPFVVNPRAKCGLFERKIHLSTRLCGPLLNCASRKTALWQKSSAMKIVRNLCNSIAEFATTCVSAILGGTQAARENVECRNDTTLNSRNLSPCRRSHCT